MKPHFTNPGARRVRRHGEARFYRAHPQPEPLLTARGDRTMSIEPIVITEPVTIRHHSPGGKGGFGYSSSPLHRLVERRSMGDLTACGVFINGSSRITVTSGKPKPAAIAKHGLCHKCWAES
jgi:hypothetical protein